MAKIICAYSGVEFSCQYLPFAISSREIAHPLFSVQKHKLLSLASTWADGNLPPTESYLLYLALLNSTGLIEWRTPVTYNDKTAAIIANNMEQLLHIVGKIDVIKHPSFVLPHFVIGEDTNTLDNSYNWIQLWAQNYSDWIEQVRSRFNDQELQRRELALNKLLKTSHRKIEDYPKILAAWARVAASFPTFNVTIMGKRQELADYWESIIIKCSREEQLFNINRNDLEELINHCNDELVADASLNSIALMRYLRRALVTHDNFLGLGDIDLASTEGTAYRILKPTESAEDANIQNMIDTAPKTEPQKHQYPDLISYIKAKGRWTVAQNYNQNMTRHQTPDTSSDTSSTILGDI